MSVGNRHPFAGNCVIWLTKTGPNGPTGTQESVLIDVSQLPCGAWKQQRKEISQCCIGIRRRSWTEGNAFNILPSTRHYFSEYTFPVLLCESNSLQFRATSVWGVVLNSRWKIVTLKIVALRVLCNVESKAQRGS